MSNKKKNDVSNFQSTLINSSLLMDILDASPRAAGIVAAAVLEVHLERLLNAHLINEPTTIRSFLGTFNAKIKAVYSLGLVSKDVYMDLETIREIRNIFAHHLETV